MKKVFFSSLALFIACFSCKARTYNTQDNTENGSEIEAKILPYMSTSALLLNKILHKDIVIAYSFDKAYPQKEYEELIKSSFNIWRNALIKLQDWGYISKDHVIHNLTFNNNTKDYDVHITVEKSPKRSFLKYGSGDDFSPIHLFFMTLTDASTTLTHEFGHAFGLGDIYFEQWGGSAIYDKGNVICMPNSSIRCFETEAMMASSKKLTNNDYVGLVMIYNERILKKSKGVDTCPSSGDLKSVYDSKTESCILEEYSHNLFRIYDLRDFKCKYNFSNTSSPVTSIAISYVQKSSKSSANKHVYFVFNHFVAIKSAETEWGKIAVFNKKNHENFETHVISVLKSNTKLNFETAIKFIKELQIREKANANELIDPYKTKQNELLQTITCGND